MSEEQQRFDELMKRVVKVSPEELRRRLKAEKTGKPVSTPSDTRATPKE